MDLRIKGQSILGLLRHAKDILFNNTGTTLTSTNVEDAIKEVNSNLSTVETHTYTVPNNLSTGTTSLTAKRCATIVQLIFTGNSIKSDQVGQWYDVATLPSNYRPSDTFTTFFKDVSLDNGTVSLLVRVTWQGIVQFYFYGANNTGINTYVSFTYIAS